ncbi:PDF receptor isoform X2 [Euwallacea similis]|uniref:PDF receptor isoform X2 n=1 Tax=Euwallacea similis TaxID=1736056 RepID=UPI00344F2052
MLAASNFTGYQMGCPEMCDSYLCWPPTAPGHNATMPCPRVSGTLEDGLAYKYCTFSGTWEVRNSPNGSVVNYTHYETCMLSRVRQLSAMCNVFGAEECRKIGRVTRYIEMVGLSLSSVSLMLSLYIFFSYRILKNNRTKIHKNLFIATLFQVIFRLVKYIDQELDESNKFLSGHYHLFETCTVLMEYSKTAMFTWMFIEGLYLHNVITVTVFQEYLYINFYIWCGWLISALMTAIWLIVMIVKDVKTTWAYYYFLPYYWILEGPRSFLIIINFLFLLNIIRVLVVKLRETQSSEIEQVKKAVRAAIFLLPLMGTAHILFLLDYTSFNEAWKFGLWSYFTYFLNTFQGFFVAVLYCFLNGEVQTAIRNSYFQRSSLRRSTYASCRGFSMGTNNGNEGDSANPTGHRWWMCCRQPPQSPEEKEIDICDISDKRDGPTSITIVETIPMIDRHSNSNGFNNGVIHKKASDSDQAESTITA